MQDRLGNDSNNIMQVYRMGRALEVACVPISSSNTFVVVVFITPVEHSHSLHDNPAGKADGWPHVGEPASGSGTHTQ